MTKIEDLGDDPVQLRAHIAELQKQNEELRFQVAKFQQMIYGRRSERWFEDQHPKLPFVEEEPAVIPPPHIHEAPDDESEAVSTDRKPRRRGVTRLREDLPRETEVIELPEDQRRCRCCGEVMQPIGQEVTQKVEYQPAVLKVREIVRVKYACRKHEEVGVATPTLPPQPVAKGVAGASLLAQVVVAKFKDHLPLYRQHKIFGRFGVDLPESTLGDWITEVATLCKPVVAAMKASILQSKVIHADDTGILVQDRAHPSGSRKSYLWAYVGDRGDVVFDFTMGRSRDGPVQFLGDYAGYLQADAYSGFDAVYSKGTVVEVGCWAHARRGFFEALETDKAHASDAMAAIQVLYKIEADARAKQLDAEATRQLRQEHCRPVLDQMRPWLQAIKKQVLPKSPLGKAVGYVLNQWDALNRYLEDGRLAIDNNLVERQIRGVALGRKNWLFAGSDAGARRAAALYSLIATCALQDVEPWAYLTDVLTRLARGEQPADLTPRAWKAQQLRIQVA